MVSSHENKQFLLHLINKRVKYCKTPTGHPKGHPCCKIADYDDTAIGTGTLTVHPWRAGPDCGKLLLLLRLWGFFWNLVKVK